MLVSLVLARLAVRVLAKFGVLVILVVRDLCYEIHVN